MRGLQICSHLFLTAALISSTGCFLFSKDPLTVGKDLVSQGRQKEAVEYLVKQMDLETDENQLIEIARYGAQLAHFQQRDYPSATIFYRYLTNYSNNPEEQLTSLKYLGLIYFDHLKDYQQAVDVYEILLRYPLNDEEKARYRLQLGKSHYNLAQVDQAEAELNAFKELKPSASLFYEGEIFESNLLVSKKEHERAAEILKRLIKEFPERAKSDGLEMNLVACYEDMKDFDAAIEAMTEMKVNYPDPEFLEMRISRLKERKNNMPGAKGLKK